MTRVTAARNESALSFPGNHQSTNQLSRRFINLYSNECPDFAAAYL